MSGGRDAVLGLVFAALTDLLRPPPPPATIGPAGPGLLMLSWGVSIWGSLTPRGRRAHGRRVVSISPGCACGANRSYKRMPKDRISSMAIAGFLMIFIGIPLGSLFIIATGFALMGLAIAIWCWKIMTF